MSKKSYLWKVMLKLNILTKDKNKNYIAKVLTIGNTLRNEDIARIITEEGSEIKYDTILNILNRSDSIKRHNLASGRNIQDGVSHISPTIHGPWDYVISKYNSKINVKTLSMVISPEMRKLLKEVEVKVIGVKDKFAYIGNVINVTTGKSDGIITPDENLIIKGEKIKITPEDEEGLGIYFTNTSTGEQTRVVKRLTVNSPKKIITQAPLLSAGRYTLSIVTRYTKNKRPLNEPRTIVYDQTLSVE